MIKKITISAGIPGDANEGYLTTGNAEWITNDPTAEGNPLTASLTGRNSQGTSLSGGIRLNHLSPEFEDTLNLNLEELKMQWPLTGQSVPWANNPYLPPVITIGS
ncbi:MAG TPA: hypothetical protein VHY08_19285, partial [Bacillota bacterium]|nr:hypothetical protein [Bacillota bacterium]